MPEPGAWVIDVVRCTKQTSCGVTGKANHANTQSKWQDQVFSLAGERFTDSRGLLIERLESTRKADPKMYYPSS